jgi:predicted transcriptional regulator
MTTIKTAISIEESLFQKAEELAAEMQVSRSRLFALALEDFIAHTDTEKLINQLNDIYADGLTGEDETWLEAARQTYVEVLGDESW